MHIANKYYARSILHGFSPVTFTPFSFGSSNFLLLKSCVLLLFLAMLLLLLLFLDDLKGRTSRIFIEMNEPKLNM